MDEDNAQEDDLVLPPTLEETKAAISALIGDITERRTWLKLQFEGRRNGLWVDWARVNATNDEISEIQGDIEALKKHASGLREEADRQRMAESVQKQRLKRENIERQAEIQREAQERKKDKTIASAMKEQERSSASHRAVMAYIKDHLPDHFQTACAVSDAAKRAIQ